MVPTVYLTWQGWQTHSNLWPILLIFVSPVAFLYLLLLAVVRLFVRWVKFFLRTDGPSVTTRGSEQPS
jgi:hypothetical protein